jgi:hypothetical protein
VLHQVPRHEDAVGIGGIVPCILNLGTTWTSVLSFRPRALYPRGKSPLRDPLNRLSGPRSRSGCGGEKKKIPSLPLTGSEFRSSSPHPCHQSIHSNSELTKYEARGPPYSAATFGILRTSSRSRDSSVAESWAFGLDDRGSESRRWLGIFLFTTVSIPVLGPTQPPIQWVPRGLSLRVKRPRRDADHSPPSSAEVKNAWNYTSTPPICLNGLVLS